MADWYFKRGSYLARLYQNLTVVFPAEKTPQHLIFIHSEQYCKTAISLSEFHVFSKFPKITADRNLNSNQLNAHLHQNQTQT